MCADNAWPRLPKGGLSDERPTSAVVPALDPPRRRSPPDVTTTVDLQGAIVATLPALTAPRHRPPVAWYSVLWAAYGWLSGSLDDSTDAPIGRQPYRMLWETRKHALCPDLRRFSRPTLRNKVPGNRNTLTHRFESTAWRQEFFCLLWRPRPIISQDSGHWAWRPEPRAHTEALAASGLKGPDTGATIHRRARNRKHGCQHENEFILEGSRRLVQSSGGSWFLASDLGSFGRASHSQWSPARWELPGSEDDLLRLIQPCEHTEIAHRKWQWNRDGGGPEWGGRRSHPGCRGTWLAPIAPSCSLQRRLKAKTVPYRRPLIGRPDFDDTLR
ncbi:hypothetical protein VTN96DRAFT_7066 [Rasamsonia emersonii]